MDNWLEQEINRRYNEIAQLFPLMEGQDFEELKADIAANGLHEAIWLHPDGSILDGRNRHRACIETKTRPQFRTWEGHGSLVSFVVSMNLHRRHLTSSQKAVIALSVLPMLEIETRKRQATCIEAACHRQKTGSLQAILPEANNSSENIGEGNNQARDYAASLFQTSPRYVQDAKTLQREAPDLLEQVRIGEKSIPQAKRELTRRQKQDPPPLPDNKYRIWYADPPWEYGNSGVIGETDNYGHVERHYPSMSITELCQMGPAIKERCSSDAVLFLWVTSPLLEECFAVIHTWGFKYKTSFVWDKVKHNFGHYNSVRHEFLLICTRGSCTPDNDKKFDSVVTCERTERHSEKPQEFRKMIDTLYPHGRRIELFAREKLDGWDTWGNEVE